MNVTFIYVCVKLIIKDVFDFFLSKRRSKKKKEQPNLQQQFKIV